MICESTKTWGLTSQRHNKFRKYKNTYFPEKSFFFCIEVMLDMKDYTEYNWFV